MLITTKSYLTHAPNNSSKKRDDTTNRDDTASQADLRRQMYERIARGHAMNEAEANANHKWER